MRWVVVFVVMVSACGGENREVECSLRVCSPDSDDCCPSACNSTNDVDCTAVCGNGTVETGELCDPVETCPQSCPQQACTLFTLVDAGTCQAQCVASGTQSACQDGDGCCPDGCNANTDSDCSPTCGNSVIEGDEQCDPLDTCPASCPQQQCDLFELANAGTCRARCVATGMQTVCQTGDDCCPDGCNANTDADCPPVCPNGVVEPGETCDPLDTCPTSCPQQGCDLRTLENAGTCMAACAITGAQTACIDGDGCCPAACNANTDSDCAPVCGNGVIEPGETCDGNCPTCTETQTCYRQSGNAATCDVVCHIPVDTCGIDGDNCCAFAHTGTDCSAGNDAECPAPGGWAYRQFPTVSYAQCVQVSMYPVIDPLGSYDITLCQPPGYPPGTGDPVITSIVDDLGHSYPVTNDDCYDATALPRLAGWNCNNDVGSLRMSCASMSPGGFKPVGAITRLTITVCPFGATATGSAPLWIWYNARNIPNPG
jgi:hypothetical protein